MTLYMDRINSATPTVGSLFTVTGSRTAASLNAAYSHLTSGPAVAVRYMAQSTDTIDELYLFLDGHGGTIGNITMECTIYNESATPSRPGSTSRDVSTAAAVPAADDMWIKFTFGTPYTPTVGEILWFVAYNTAGDPATDYPQILVMTNHGLGPPTSGAASMFGFYTSTGFSTNGTAANEIPFVVKQGSVYWGQPFTQRANGYASGTLERGMQITPEEDVVVSGITWLSGSTTLADFRILADATAPGGGAIASYNLDTDTNETTCDAIGAKVFDAPVTLTGGTTYKCTFTFDSATQNPTVMEIEDYATYSSLFDTLRAYDTMRLPWSVIDDGAGGWTIDKKWCPEMALIVQTLPAVGGLIVHPGMSGGMRG